MRGSIAPPINDSNTTYTESDCTIAYTYQGSPIPTTLVALGMVRGHLSCPSMTDGQQWQVTGGFDPKTCEGEADFLFENCMQ